MKGNDEIEKGQPLPRQSMEVSACPACSRRKRLAGSSTNVGQWMQCPVCDRLVQLHDDEFGEKFVADLEAPEEN